jgi:SET domain-containing protein
MITLTIKLNENSKKGKAFLEFDRPFFEESKNVKLVDSDDKELLKQVSTYNPEFVKKVLEAKKKRSIHNFRFERCMGKFRVKINAHRIVLKTEIEIL